MHNNTGGCPTHVPRPHTAIQNVTVQAMNNVRDLGTRLVMPPPPHPTPPKTFSSQYLPPLEKFWVREWTSFLISFGTCFNRAEGRHDALNPGFHSRFCPTPLKKSRNKIWNEKRGFKTALETYTSRTLPCTVVHVHTQMHTYQSWSRHTIQNNDYDLTATRQSLGGELYTTTQYSFTHMDITWQTLPINLKCLSVLTWSVSWYF